MTAPGPFTIGVEEEYLIVDADTGELRPRADRILPEARQALGDEVQPELIECQIEVGTPVCATLDELGGELRRLRREVREAAEPHGSTIIATGTHPFTHWLGQSPTPKQRYLGLYEDFQQLAREQIISGCHVHVGVDDAELAIEVMNRVRPWLAVLLALTGNSPFWLGLDTGYSSYRSQLFHRWPQTGVPQAFASRAELDELVHALAKAGVIEDLSNIYWDVRPSHRFATLEFRVADVCLTVDEAIAYAALCRSLVRRCAADAVAGRPVAPVRPELLRAAHWRAARWGLDGELIDVDGPASLPASEVVAGLLRFLRADLEGAGEWDTVAALVAGVLARGNGAHRQRAVFEATDSLEKVVGFAVAETAKDT